MAVFAGGRAYAEQTRQPTQAELSAAAAAGIAQRWERMPAGTIFPPVIRYFSAQTTRETARRIDIDPADGCAGAVDGTLRRRAEADGCVAGLRADYTDQLFGEVYTLGILAFPSAAAASRFYSVIPSSHHPYPATGLQALAVPGTPAALFGDAARQASASELAGPYVVLSVAGYADGRHANAADERRQSVFAPQAQLVSTVAAPLAKRETVRCGKSEWACLSGVPVPPPNLAQVRPEELKTLTQIQVPQAWRTSRGAGVTVAVLDTGVDASAPDMLGSVRSGHDYTAGADPSGYHPPLVHGTYIASLIAGHGSGPDDTLGVVGVAPRAKILSVRVILDDGEPGMVAYNDKPKYANAIGEGIYYAVNHGAQVINMSLGSQQPSAYLRAAVAYAVAKGVVVVASAGNNGAGRGFSPYVYPAAFTGVIAVAAVTRAGQRASFSEQNAAVILSAPGVDVLGAGPGGEYLDAEGTSPAAALVSGVAALIRSRYPRLSPALVEQALITAAARRPRGGYSPGTGFGEVDAQTALAAAGRLASATPSSGLAAAADFAGAAGRRGTPAPIQVVHRNAASIVGYTVAAGAGALCCLIALGIGIVLTRRPEGPEGLAGLGGPGHPRGPSYPGGPGLAVPEPREPPDPPQPPDLPWE